MTVIGVRELLIRPVFTGGNAAMSKQLSGFSAGAGKAAGISMGKGVASGFSETAQKLKTEVADLEKAMSKSQGQITTAKAKIASSSEAEAKAVGLVRVAELKLKEVRDSARSTDSQKAAAEERLAEAHRKATKATGGRMGAENALKIASGELATAQTRSASASAELDTELKKGGRSAEGSGRKFDGLAASVGKFAKAGALAAGAVVVAGGAALTKGVVDAMGIEVGTSKLETRLGLTKEQSAMAGKATGAVYAQNFGASMEAVSAATESVISSIKGMRNASQSEIEDMTKRMLVLSDSMEIDVTRASQVAGQMISSGLAANGVEAADLLTSALQKVPAAVREDVLDAVDEYGPFFKNLGYSGEQAMDLLVKASAKGMYGIDKTGDALKEFGIRATDMSKATGAAYEALGLDQQDMTNQLLAGGDTARAAYEKIVGGLQGIKDPAMQSSAALALFGTPLEDLSVTEIPAFLDSMTAAEGGLGDVAGASDRAMDTVASTASAGFSSFKRQAEGALIKFVQENIMPAVGGFATFLANDVGPKVSGFLDLLSGARSILFEGDFKGGLMGIEEDHPLVGFLLQIRDGFLGSVTALRDFGTWVVKNKDWLLSLTAGVVAGVAAFQAYLIVNSVVGAIKAYSIATTIATAKAWLLNTALLANPVGLVIAGIAALVAGLVWFFTQTELGQQIVQNVWAAIQSAVGGTVAWFQAYVLPTIQAVFAAVGAVFSWLWTNIVQPVFGFIAGAVQAWWMVTSYIFGIFVALLQKVIGPAITWLYETIFRPIFTAIGALVSVWWNTVVMPVFNAVRDFISNILGPAFRALYEIFVKPIFDNIGAAIKWNWDNIIQPIFEALRHFVQDILPEAFKLGVEAIKTFWERLQDIAKAPVKFVIQTVINDGLIAGLNGIGGFLGLDPLPKVALPPGFADGGYTGPGGKYQPAGIVHAGEVVWSQADIARWGGVGVVEAMRTMVGYAKGGLVHPLRQSTVSQPFSGSHNGIDFAAPTGTPIGAAGPGRVSSAGWSSYGGGNEIHIDHPNGLQTWYAHLSSFAVKMGDMVRASQLIGQVGSTGNSTGPHLHYMVLNGDWPNYVNPSSYLEGGGEPGSGGWNPVAGIVDGLVESFKKAFPAAGFVADLAIGAGKKLLDGAVGFVTGKGGKDDGIGETGMPYLYDNGGVLNPGLTQVLNATRKPEAIYTNEQNRALQALAERGANRGGSVVLPQRMKLMVGAREFDAYMSETADSRIGDADHQSSFRRAGR